MRSVTDGEGTGRTDAVQLGARTLPLKARGTISGDETSASSTVGEFGPEGVPTAVRSEDWGTVQVNATPAPGRIRVSALARNRNSVTGGSVGQARPVVGSPPHRPRQSRSAGLIPLDWPPIALATGPKARGGCPGFLHAAAQTIRWFVQASHAASTAAERSRIPAGTDCDSVVSRTTDSIN